MEQVPHPLKIGILNGPNLNLLGKRKPEIYGNRGFEDYLQELKTQYPDFFVDFLQSNHEGVLIDTLQDWGFRYDGIILNPAAYTHTSVAIADAIEAIPAPVIEVHISDVFRRENFRKTSYLRAHCLKTITGEGLEGYQFAFQLFIDLYKFRLSSISGHHKTG